MQERTRDPIKPQHNNVFLALEILRRGHGADVFDTQALQARRRAVFAADRCTESYTSRESRSAQRQK